MAAPTFVPGAIAATGHESSTNAPAEAARAPCGRHVADHRDLRGRIACVIWRIEEIQAAGRVDLDQHGGRAVVGRALDRAARGSRRRTGRPRRRAAAAGPSRRRPARRPARRATDRRRPRGSPRRRAAPRATSVACAVRRSRIDVTLVRRLWSSGSNRAYAQDEPRAGRPASGPMIVGSTAPASRDAARAPVYRKERRVNARNDGPLLPREEQQLMEGLLAGNDDAIRALYARFGRPVYSLGLRLLGTPRGRRGAHAGRLPHGVAQGRAVRPGARAAVDLAHDDRAQPRRRPAPPRDRRVAPDARARRRGARRARGRRGGAC